MTEQGLLDWLNILATKRYIMETLKEKFERENAELIQSIADIEASIKAEVLNRGESVSTERITAIWNKGKTSWDGKLLEGYALAHPDVLAARKVGQPTVSFRMAKKQ